MVGRHVLFCFRVPSGHPFFAKLVACLAEAAWLMAWRLGDQKGVGLWRCPSADAVRGRMDPFVLSCSAASAFSPDLSKHGSFVVSGARLAEAAKGSTNARRRCNVSCRCVSLRCVPCRCVPCRCTRRSCRLAARWQCAATQPTRWQQACLRRGLAAALPSTSSATAFRQQLRHSKRSGSGERSGVVHGVCGVWQRFGKPHPSGHCVGSNLGSVTASSPPPPPTVTATAFSQQLRRGDRQQHRQRQRPC